MIADLSCYWPPLETDSRGSVTPEERLPIAAIIFAGSGFTHSIERPASNILKAMSLAHDDGRSFFGLASHQQMLRMAMRDFSVRIPGEKSRRSSSTTKRRKLTPNCAPR